VLPLLIRLPAFELVDAFLPVEEAFGARGKRLLEQLSDPALRAQVPHRMAAFLEREFAARDFFSQLPGRRVRSVRELANITGWSARTLQYRATKQIGLAPKLWLRIERLHRAIAFSMKQIGPWRDIALQCGFADQAHMIREFVNLLGESPTAWCQRGPFLPPNDRLEELDAGQNTALRLESRDHQIVNPSRKAPSRQETCAK